VRFEKIVMQTAVFVVVPLLVFAYMAFNGLAMALSPVKWARSKWTAKGQYKYEDVESQIRSGKAFYWRIAGICMLLLSLAACILITHWAICVGPQGANSRDSPSIGVAWSEVLCK